MPDTQEENVVKAEEIVTKAVGYFPNWGEAHKNSEGTVVIPYTFKGTPPDNTLNFKYTDSTHFSEEQKSSALRHMRYIETIANVRFEEVEPDKAKWTFFQSRTINHAVWQNGNDVGWMENAGSLTDPRVTIHIDKLKLGFKDAFDEGKLGSHTILHEMLHGLGMGHIGGGGEDVSIMSYQNTSNTLRMGDMLALVRIFGKSTAEGRSIWNKSEFEDHDVVIPNNGLPITLQFSKPSDAIELDLSKRTNPKTGIYSSTPIQIDEDAEITHVKVIGNGELFFTGGKESTTVEGGSKNDQFFPKGGPDIITGGDGKDTFWLTESAGLGHRVTDFDPKKDVFFIKKSEPDKARVLVEFKISPAGEETGMIIEHFSPKQSVADGSIIFDFTKSEESKKSNPHYEFIKESIGSRLLKPSVSHQLIGKTPEDKLKLEELACSVLKEGYDNLKAYATRDLSGNPIIVFPIDAGKDVKEIAKTINSTFKYDVEKLGDDPIGIGVSTIKDDAGNEREVLATTSRRIHNVNLHCLADGNKMINLLTQIVFHQEDTAPTRYSFTETDSTPPNHGIPSTIKGNRER